MSRFRNSSAFVFLGAVKFWQRLSLMSLSRLPKLCFDRLLDLDSVYPDSKYNWVTQVRSLVNMYGLEEVWEEITSFLTAGVRQLLKNHCEGTHQQNHMLRIRSSSFNYWYPRLKRKFECDLYLKENISLDKKEC